MKKPPVAVAAWTAVSPPLSQALVASTDREGQFNGGSLLDAAMGFSLGSAAPQNSDLETTTCFTDVFLGLRGLK